MYSYHGESHIYKKSGAHSEQSECAPIAYKKIEGKLSDCNILNNSTPV